MKTDALLDNMLLTGLISAKMHAELTAAHEEDLANEAESAYEIGFDAADDSWDQDIYGCACQ